MFGRLGVPEIPALPLLRWSVRIVVVLVEVEVEDVLVELVEVEVKTVVLVELEVELVL